MNLFDFFAMTPFKYPPQNVAELLQRAERLAGFQLGELAELAGLQAPQNLKRHKGWIGQLLELWLGASAGSKQVQDFAHLGIELKTIPIANDGQPLETTYVCYAHLMGIAGLTWENSNVKNKLSQVLWIPVQGERSIPPALRAIGNPIFWQPTQQELEELRCDWEEIMEKIALGEVDAITARHGTALQLRPKAANGQALTSAIGPRGSTIQTRPRGFYLKKNFTRRILANHYMAH